ncbi:MAG: peptide-methionine (S)-S-oxide reductase MsrA [Persicimonas sp.]
MSRRHLLVFAVVVGLLSLVACRSPKPTDSEGSGAATSENEARGADKGVEKIRALAEEPEDDSLEIATFAGGCFWCMEPPFDRIDGVTATIVGYTGGEEAHPTYEQVASGQTSHAEAIRVYYEPEEVSYAQLLEVFWRNIDPTQTDGQFVDRGTQYRSAIYYHDPRQKQLAEESKAELERSGPFDEPIVTELEPAGTFWRAEEYHQDFYKKDPARYKSYRRGSGRDQFIERIWGDQ